MGSYTLNVQYSKNQYQIFSSSEFKTLFLKNLPLVDQFGNQISDDDIDFWIQSSQKEIEDILDLKFNKQCFSDNKDYTFDDWTQWGFFQTTYPAIQGLSLQGFLNTTLQVDYPIDWLVTKKTSDGELYQRTINLVPVQGSANSLTNNVVFAGVAPYIGYFGRKDVPLYWTAQYLTGFDKIPETLMRLTMLKTAINILPLISFNVIKPGVASQSLGIDGLSQSKTSTANASKLSLGALIDSYTMQYDKLKDVAVKKYCGIAFGVL